VKRVCSVQAAQRKERDRARKARNRADKKAKGDSQEADAMADAMRKKRAEKKAKGDSQEADAMRKKREKRRADGNTQEGDANRLRMSQLREDRKAVDNTQEADAMLCALKYDEDAWLVVEKSPWDDVLEIGRLLFQLGGLPAMIVANQTFVLLAHKLYTERCSRLHSDLRWQWGFWLRLVDSALRSLPVWADHMGEARGKLSMNLTGDGFKYKVAPLGSVRLVIPSEDETAHDIMY